MHFRSLNVFLTVSLLLAVVLLPGSANASCSPPYSFGCGPGSSCYASTCVSRTLQSRSSISKVCKIYQGILTALGRKSTTEVQAVEQFCSIYNEVTKTTTPTKTATSTAPTSTVKTSTTVTSNYYASVTTTVTVDDYTTSVDVIDDTTTVSTFYYTDLTTAVATYTVSTEATTTTTPLARRAQAARLQRPACLSTVAAGAALSQACSCIVPTPSVLTKTAPTKTVTKATVTPRFTTTLTSVDDVTSTSTLTSFTTTDITVVRTTTSVFPATATATATVEQCVGECGCYQNTAPISSGSGYTLLSCYQECEANSQCVSFQYDIDNNFGGYCNLFNVPTSQIFDSGAEYDDSAYCSGFGLFDLDNCHPVE